MTSILPPTAPAPPVPPPRRPGRARSPFRRLRLDRALGRRLFFQAPPACLPLGGLGMVLLGCGRVVAMNRLNLLVTGVQLAVNWTALAAGAGLLAAPIGVTAGVVVNGCVVFVYHRRLLADLWRAPRDEA